MSTATERVRHDIAAQLRLNNPSVLVGTFDRPNLVYRIVPRDFHRTPPVRLSKVATDKLVAQLESRNGWTRDTASRLLYERQDRAAVGPLEQIAAASKLPQARLHALYALAGLGGLRAEVVLQRLADDDPRVREHAVRLTEGLAGNPRLREAH